MKKEQIIIDIPKGKVPVMEQTENGVVITWKEKELAYYEIYEYLCLNKEVIPYYVTTDVSNRTNDSFNRKINALRKLINIRNYFGKPDKNKEGWTIEQGGVRRIILESKYNDFSVVFAEHKHAEEAIRMLGDELKYLFEPW